MIHNTIPHKLKIKQYKHNDINEKINTQIKRNMLRRITLNELKINKNHSIWNQRLTGKKGLSQNNNFVAAI